MTHFSELFSQQEIQELRKQGKSDQEIQQAVDQATTETNNGLAGSYARTQQNKANDPRASASNSFIAGSYQDNLIQWQLELDSILERIEHMLRGDKPTWKNGSIIWESPKETYILKEEEGEELSEEEKRICYCLNKKNGLSLDQIKKKVVDIEEQQLKTHLNNLIKKRVLDIEDGTILNDFGVSEIMRILSNYINRNTILSNYSEDIIDLKLYDIGHELSDLIYLKYEKMGLKDLEKRKLYPIIVREMVDIVHSSYLRALNGGERESLREARQVSQTDSLGAGVNINTGQPHRERGLLNPLRYLGGKHK